jgi:hypothetical protein
MHGEKNFCRRLETARYGMGRVDFVILPYLNFAVKIEKKLHKMRNSLNMDAYADEVYYAKGK